MSTPNPTESRIQEILQHTRALPIEFDRPLPHYRRTTTDLWNTRVIDEAFSTQLDAHMRVQHMARVNSMIMASLIATFERLLKELAAKCVDQLAHCVLDDRFDVFNLDGSGLAAHFEAKTLGNSLCESVVWHNCKDINDRFRTLLAPLFEKGQFYLFPAKNNQEPRSDQWRFNTLNIVWQLRHTIVHNVGVVTHSDAIKFRLLAKCNVQASCGLAPTRDDMLSVKRFLDDTAEFCNRRIGERLAKLLTEIHGDNPTLFVPAEIASQLARDFGIPVVVAGVQGQPPA